MKIVIISGIPGVHLDSCCDELKLHALKKEINLTGPFCVENNVIPVAKQTLDILGIEEPYRLENVLQLPYEELCNYFNLSFENTLKYAKDNTPENDIALVTFHPVLYHMLTRSFINPYNHHQIINNMRTYNIELIKMVSIHDDIYDIYKELVKPKQIFNPIINRDNPYHKPQRQCGKDIEEQRIILDWRDRELSSSRSIARSIGANHFLFHKKGRIDTLWEVAFNNSPCVYFSHPISQPRRDINGIPDRVKSQIPDKKRGEQLITSCQTLSNRIGAVVPLVEPTAIDEYRINTKELTNISESDLCGYCLPPLTSRWPIGSGERLFGKVSQDNEEGTIKIDSDLHKDMELEEGNLDKHKTAIELLSAEIARQITVRDYCLAEQAQLIIAYRPFSLPDIPDPTGGVEKEIAVLKRKILLNKHRCSPAIIIINPPEDEYRRRKNEFESIWDVIKESIHADAEDKLSKFHDKCIDILYANLDLDNGKIKNDLAKAIEESEINIYPKKDTSSMFEQPLARESDAKKEFVKWFINDTTILKSPHHKTAEELGEREILWIQEEPNFLELATNIQDIIKKYRSEINEHNRTSLD